MVVNFKRLASLHLAVAGMAELSPGLTQETGKELYHAACAACHGGDGSGNSATQLGFLDLAVPDFTDCDFAAREPDPDWYAVIHAGGPVRGFDRMMPSFGDALEPDQIQAILDHVRTMCTDDQVAEGRIQFAAGAVYGEGLSGRRGRADHHARRAATGTPSSMSFSGSTASARRTRSKSPCRSR